MRMSFMFKFMGLALFGSRFLTFVKSDFVFVSTGTLVMLDCHTKTIFYSYLGVRLFDLCATSLTSIFFLSAFVAFLYRFCNIRLIC